MFVLHPPIHAIPVEARPKSTGGAGAGLAIAFVLLVGGAIAAGAFLVSGTRSAPTNRTARAWSTEPVAAVASAPRPKPNLSSTGRPLVHDVDGDGTKDVIVWMNGAFTALNGKTGEEIWSAPSKGDRFQAFATIVGHHLVDVSGVSVAFVDLGKGALEGEVTLEDKARMPCDLGPAFAGVLLADGDVAKIDVGSHKVTIEKAGGCKEAESDLARRPDLVERKYMPPDEVSAAVDAVSCGGTNVTGTYNYVLPDPCGPKGGPQMKSLGDFDPALLVSTRFGFVVLGQKAKGLKIPVAARIDKNKVVWNNTISAAPKTSESSLAPVAILDDHFAGIFGVDGKPHLFSASIETGIPDFDVALDEPVNFLAAGTASWILVGRDFIDLADPRTGQTRRLFGWK